MNRIIKFRAWDKMRNGFLNEEEGYTLGVDLLGFVRDIEEAWGDEVDLEDRFVLMQFTGLLDKHGKEIYEGDMVDMTGKEVVVTFADGAFQVSGVALSEWDPTNWAVIGNIYQNYMSIK